MKGIFKITSPRPIVLTDEIFIFYDSSPFKPDTDEHVSLGLIHVHHDNKLGYLGRMGSYDPKTDFKTVRERGKPANLYERVRYLLKGVPNDPHPRQLEKPVFIAPNERGINVLGGICTDLGYICINLDQSPHTLH